MDKSERIGDITHVTIWKLIVLNRCLDKIFAYTHPVLYLYLTSSEFAVNDIAVPAWCLPLTHGGA